MQYQFGPGPLKSEYDPMIQKLKSDIGIVEETDIAQHAIANGQYVVWKGDLYTAKSDISIGTTLSSSNLQSKTRGIGEDVAALNNKLKRTVLSTATDFNTLRTTGNVPNQYYCGDNIAIHSGIPSGVGSNIPFTLDVISMGSYSVQILRTYASTSGPIEYKRQTYYSSGSTPYNTWTSLDGKILNRQNRTYVSTVSAFNEYCTNLGVGVGADVAATGDVMNAIVGINGFGIMSIVKVSNSGVHISYAIAFNQHVGSCVYNFTNSTTTNLNDLNSKTKYEYNTNARAWKCGNFVYIVCSGGNWYADADGPLKESANGSEWTLPVGYRPIQIVDLLESYGQSRIQIKADGKVCSAASKSGVPVRFSTTFMVE